MAVQQHKIMRQVLEIRGCPPGDADRLGAEMRGAYFARLLPAIERACSDASDPGRLHRIDTLTIDLGTVPLSGLDQVVAERFASAFRSSLEAALESAPPIDSNLELFTCFLHTGTVPWWADRADGGLLETNLAALISRAPGSLRRLLAALRDSDQVHRRIARAYPDELLDDLLGVLMPAMVSAYPAIVATVRAMRETSSGTRGHASRSTAIVWREETLRAACAEAGGPAGALADAPANVPANAPVFLRALLVRVARRLGVEYPVLLAELGPALATMPAAQRWLRETGQPPRQEARTRGEAPARDTPSPARREEREAAFDPQVGDTDAVYVENAGLVLLWPFLESFFARLGLLTERRFTDDAAAHRAVGLLQHIATGSDALPEPLLPLNKLLCGVAPDDVFDLGPEITPREIEECDHLLAAVIQRAPILNAMSVAGFRGSFLLRTGQLSTRDGQWLLRVERATYDVVLDRLPWSVAFVKLPWMHAMIQVEWLA